MSKSNLKIFITTRINLSTPIQYILAKETLKLDQNWRNYDIACFSCKFPYNFICGYYHVESHSRSKKSHSRSNRSLLLPACTQKVMCFRLVCISPATCVHVMDLPVWSRMWFFASTKYIYFWKFVARDWANILPWYFPHIIYTWDSFVHLYF